MKSALMCMCTSFVFFVAGAVAQSNPPADNTTGSQGTTTSSPSMGQQPSGTMDSPQGASNQGSMGNSTNSNGNMNGNMKTERKMKGCIQSQGGQYVLQTKHGKDVMLSGQDVSAHVGHEVAVHGMWEGSGNMSNTASGSGSMSGKSFNVIGVDMISDTCTSSKKSGSSNPGLQ